MKGLRLSSLAAVLSLGACAHSAPLPAKAIALNRDGAAALAEGDLETAEARVALALEYNPRFTEAWVNLGLVELRRGNFELAMADFVRARDLNPDLPTPHHALGLLAEARGEPRHAETYYRAALHVDPGFAPARSNLGRILFARGELEEAREQFLRLTQVAPEAKEGWTGLVESLLRLAREEEAEQALLRARARFGAIPPLELLAARVLLRQGAFAEARRHLEPLTRVGDDRQVSAALAWLAIARIGEGDEPGAIEAARRAASLDPDDGVARYALRVAGAEKAGDH
ncbi:MAG TPA: tetratricopeptide repeat protein [Polyangiaceae bacterium]|jgi:tetratricopeptide (TPR) repeat protein|nr:tetratricopeptide repeat protein [Polyangiaceae bacterium]